MSNNGKTLHDLFHTIYVDFGEEVLTETRLKGLLCDYGGTSVNKYQHIVTRSISYHVGSKLLAIKGIEESEFLLKLNNLRQAFQEENFFRHDIANYIIDCYLYALGWVDTIEEVNEDDDQCGNTKSGELSFVEHSGAEYCGNLNTDKERSGFGISKDEHFNYYAGEWKLNLRNGMGMEVSSERNKYAGEWRLNRRAGVGVETMDDGNRYAGEWKNGKTNGSGILIFPNGEKMCTTFKNGQPDPNAVGIFYFKDGSYLIGHMSPEGPDGVCTHYKRDGSSVEEKWNKGRQD